MRGGRLERKTGPVGARPVRGGVGGRCRWRKGGDAVGQVQVFDVQTQHLVSAGCGFVEHPPQRPLSQCVPRVGAQSLDHLSAQCPVVIVGDLPWSRQPPESVRQGVWAPFPISRVVRHTRRHESPG